MRRSLFLLEYVPGWRLFRSAVLLPVTRRLAFCLFGQRRRQRLRLDHPTVPRSQNLLMLLSHAHSLCRRPCAWCRASSDGARPRHSRQRPVLASHIGRPIATARELLQRSDCRDAAHSALDALIGPSCWRTSCHLQPIDLPKYTAVSTMRSRMRCGGFFRIALSYFA